jgi:hypothetical protein
MFQVLNPDAGHDEIYRARAPTIIPGRVRSITFVQEAELHWDGWMSKVQRESPSAITRTGAASWNHQSTIVLHIAKILHEQIIIASIVACS